MNVLLVIHILGALAILLSGAMLPSLGIAWFGEADPLVSTRATHAFATTIILSATAGIAMFFGTRNHAGDHLHVQDGFAVTAFGWILMAALGAIPFYLCRDVSGMLVLDSAPGSTPAPSLSWLDAYFETMSGFTTTGASVFGTARSAGGNGLIEAMPASLLFWRSMTHWLGGMGIIVLCLAILPALRTGVYQMFAAEVPGPTAERLRPRIRETAAILWGVYVVFSVAEVLLLWLGKMPLLDAFCHMCGTMATGGFSTKDASIGHYAMSGHPGALYFEIVIIIFMFLAGCNFLLHYQALKGALGYHRNGEFRFYGVLLALSILIATVMLRLGGGAAQDGWGDALRAATFQVLSITTTTGYVTEDFNLWPGFCRCLLVVLMFFGGCAGSTGGGLKQIRILVTGKYVLRELRRLLRPRLTTYIRVGSEIIEARTLRTILSLVLLYVIIFTVATLGVMLCLDLTGAAAASQPDSVLVTATTAVAATLNNIGPGLSGVGATGNYGAMPACAKVILTLCMLMGRLEVYTVLVILLPTAWRG